MIAATDITSNSHIVVFRWHIPSLNKGSLVPVCSSRACQTSKVCKQGTRDKCPWAYSVMPWCLPDMELLSKSKMQSCFCYFRINYSGHVHCASQNSGIVCTQKKGNLVLNKIKNYSVNIIFIICCAANITSKTRGNSPTTFSFEVCCLQCTDL